MKPAANVFQPQVEQALTQLGVAYEVRGEALASPLQVASLFKPIDSGFYFLKGRELPSGISRSLILTDHASSEESTNQWLEVRDDPQRVYYRVLDLLFPTRSTGTIAASASIHPEAEIGRGVQIDPGCVIGACRLDDDVIIGAGTVIQDRVRIGARTVVEPLSVIGARGMAWVWNEQGDGRHIQPQLGGVQVGEDCVLGAQTVIVRGSLNEDTELGRGVLMAPGCRLGHGTIIGDHAHLANSVSTAGNVTLGAGCFVGSGAVFRPRIQIHEQTIIGAGSVVTHATTGPGMTLRGVPAREYPTNNRPWGVPIPPRQESEP